MADLPALWSHPGVIDKQREELVREIFQEVRLRESEIIAAEPRLDYKPLFACIIAEGVRKSRGEWI